MGWRGQGTDSAEGHGHPASFPSRGFLQMRSRRGSSERQKTRSEERETGQQPRGGEWASGGGEGGRPRPQVGLLVNRARLTGCSHER